MQQLFIMLIYPVGQELRQGSMGSSSKTMMSDILNGRDQRQGDKIIWSLILSHIWELMLAHTLGASLSLHVSLRSFCMGYYVFPQQHDGWDSKHEHSRGIEPGRGHILFRDPSLGSHTFLPFYIVSNIYKSSWEFKWKEHRPFPTAGWILSHVVRNK